MEAAAAPSRLDVVGNVGRQRSERVSFREESIVRKRSGKPYRKESTARKRNGRLSQTVTNEQQPDKVDNVKKLELSVIKIFE